MIVISDTSVVSALIKVGRLEILKSLFTEVIIPRSVLDELLVCHLEIPEWIRPMDVRNREAVIGLLTLLDLGESEAIILSEETGAALLLMDGKAGRSVARERGISTLGLLGAALIAHRRGFLGCHVRDLIADLREKAGFRISAELAAKVLADAGE